MRRCLTRKKPPNNTLFLLRYRLCYSGKKGFSPFSMMKLKRSSYAKLPKKLAGISLNAVSCGQFVINSNLNGDSILTRFNQLILPFSVYGESSI